MSTLPNRHIDVTTLIASVAAGAKSQDVPVSMKEVGWIVSTFLEGFIAVPGEPLPEPILWLLQALADGAAAIEDDGGLADDREEPG